jgi:hypothetical protein
MAAEAPPGPLIDLVRMAGSDLRHTASVHHDLTAVLDRLDGHLDAAMDKVDTSRLKKG